MRTRATYEELPKDTRSIELMNQTVQNSISNTIIIPTGTKNAQITPRKIDRQTKSLLSYLFTGMRGGDNRIKIMLLLAENPLNINQLSKKLGFDYKAIKHHIEVLEKNNMIEHTGEKYGTMYYLSTFLEYHIDAFNEIVEDFHKRSQLE